MTGPVAVLDRVGRTYRQGRRRLEALHDVSLTVNDGEFIAVRGPSGSGKSTLVRILGLLDTPSQGSIQLFGRPLPRSDRALSQLRNAAIGFVFQEYRLVPHYSALQNVSVPLKIAGLSGRKQRRQASELLEMVGLADATKAKASELSGGQQQRVGIARALAMQPQILIADEPTGNLDSTTGEAIMSLLTSINEDLGTTIVMVTHDANVAALAHRTVTIRDGRLEEHDRELELGKAEREGVRR